MFFVVFVSNTVYINHFVMYKNDNIVKNNDAVHYFRELLFYNKPIGKPNVKWLKNIDRLAELPFYEQLNIMKTNQAFSGYAASYKVEIVERKDPVVQLETVKSSIKDLFNDLFKSF